MLLNYQCCWDKEGPWYLGICAKCLWFLWFCCQGGGQPLLQCSPECRLQWHRPCCDWYTYNRTSQCCGHPSSSSWFNPVHPNFQSGSEREKTLSYLCYYYLTAQTTNISCDFRAWTRLLQLHPALSLAYVVLHQKRNRTFSQSQRPMWSRRCHFGGPQTPTSLHWGRVFTHKHRSCWNAEFFRRSVYHPGKRVSSCMINSFTGDKQPDILTFIDISWL